MKHPPALLLGGVNLVRALGLGGVPAIVASPQPDAPAMASRFAQGRLLLAPLERRDAVIETVLRAGERLAHAAGRKVPLVYGCDDYLNLIQENHAALAPYFALILNEPKVYDVFSWTDPMPFVRHCMTRTRRIRRLIPRVKPWLSTAS